MNLKNIYNLKATREQISNLIDRVFFLDNGGMALSRDTDLKENVKAGYESNATVFGAVNRLSRMFSEFPKIPYIAGTEDIAKADPIKAMFAANPSDYTYHEFQQHWYLFGLCTGESIVYRPIKMSQGNKKPLTFNMMPSQNVEIISGGWMNPIKNYEFDIDGGMHKFMPEDVWHTRLYLNLDFTNGRQFRGLSPLKVAMVIINAMNKGDLRVSDLYETGLPPGMLINKDVDSEEDAGKAKSLLERVWRRKKKDVPIFGAGSLSWEKIGTDSINDLKYVDTNQLWREVLYSVWGVSPELFMATGTTFNNKKNAEKAAYTDRILPDVQLYCDGLNEITIPAWNIEYKPDPQSIPALQEDMKELMEVASKSRQNKIWTVDEARVYTKKEPIEDDITGEEGLLNELETPLTIENDKNDKNDNAN
jgi:hypothetical protein